MRFEDIHQVPATVERAVVINVATEVVSAVAIASVLRNAGMPLLVVNCTADPASKVLMGGLADNWGFDLVDLQLAPHGVTLDRLFRSLHADRILLLDSDAEIRDPMVTARMRQAFVDPTVYGAGWVHDADWLTGAQSGVFVNGQEAAVAYAERPWIPCAMFRTSFVRAGLDAGQSFNESFLVGSNVMAAGFSPQFLNGRVPLSVHNDTGADLHRWANASGFRFDGPSVYSIENEVAHHHGVTRLMITPNGGNGTMLNDVEAGALEALRNTYSQYWPGFANAVVAAQPA